MPRALTKEADLIFEYLTSISHVSVFGTVGPAKSWFQLSFLSRTTIETIPVRLAMTLYNRLQRWFVLSTSRFRKRAVHDGGKLPSQIPAAQHKKFHYIIAGLFDRHL